MADKESEKWHRSPKLSFNSRDLSRRMRKAEGATVKHARRFVFRRLDNVREVRRHITLWIVMIGVIIGASGLQLFWYQQSYHTVTAANDGIYAEAVLGPINTLNPIFANSPAEESAGHLLFSRLLDYDKTGHLNYDLASRMTVSADSKTYTIEIRPDARWTDGIYVRARDVVFTVNLLKNPATRATISGWNDITVSAVDDRTVAFQLPSVYAPFPHALSYLPILPQHVLRDIDPSAIRENSFSSNPVGSGPFTLRTIQDIDQTDDRKIVHLARNQAYYRGAPKLDRFQLHVYNNSEAIAEAISNAEVNAATNLRVADTVDINTERYVIERKPLYSGVYALLNTSSQFLKDSKLRAALQAGTDTAGVRAAVGDGTPALHLPFIDGQLGGDVPAPPAYDTAAAERLLDQAGWVRDGLVRKKDGVNLKLSVVALKNSDHEKVLDVLVNQWRALGISISTSIADPSDPEQNVVQNILQPRNYDVLVYELPTGVGADPDIYAYWHSSQASGGLNFSNYSSSVSDDALVSARSRTEADLRNVKYLTFARQWLADAPAIGLYQSTMQYVHSVNVNAMTEEQRVVTSTDRYSTVLYWSVGERRVQQTP